MPHVAKRGHGKEGVAKMGYNVQSNGPDATVKVHAGTDHGTGQPQTDVIISEAGYPNDHRHVVFDVNGNMVYDQINPNHLPPQS